MTANTNIPDLKIVLIIPILDITISTKRCPVIMRNCQFLLGCVNGKTD